MKIIKITLFITFLFVSLFVVSQYQRKRATLPAERTTNDSIVEGIWYKYKIYGDIIGTRTADIKIVKVKNDSVWYNMGGIVYIEKYKKLKKWIR